VHIHIHVCMHIQDFWKGIIIFSPIMYVNLNYWKYSFTFGPLVTSLKGLIWRCTPITWCTRDPYRPSPSTGLVKCARYTRRKCHLVAEGRISTRLAKLFLHSVWCSTLNTFTSFRFTEFFDQLCTTTGCTKELNITLCMTQVTLMKHYAWINLWNV
jgi:hypothetical protein